MQKQFDGFIHEDELPDGYPYEAEFPHSRILGGVRMFPIVNPPRDYDDSVLCFRAVGYHGDLNDCRRIVGFYTGYVTEKKAHEMVALFKATGFLSDCHVQIRLQGDEWRRLGEKIESCLLCGDKLVGHEDESRTHCRWHVTGQPANNVIAEATT